MKRFVIYERDSDSSEAEAVKRGFSWPAFLFGWVWGFANRLPVHGGVMLAISIGFLTAEQMLPTEGLGTEISIALFWAYSIVLGAYGNSWREESLRSMGFDEVATVEAGSADDAISLEASLPRR
jgi:hypothetical protein